MSTLKRDEENYGPVTKLAQIKAVEDEKARIRQRQRDREHMKHQALAVGEAALALASMQVQSGSSSPGNHTSNSRRRANSGNATAHTSARDNNNTKTRNEATSRGVKDEGRQDTPPKEDVNPSTFHYQHHIVSAYEREKHSRHRNATDASPAVSRAGRSTNSSNPRHRVYNADEPVRADRERDHPGLFTAVKSWLTIQREKLHEIELERQVEEQRRILVLEGRKRRAIEAEKRRQAKEEQQRWDQNCERDDGPQQDQVKPRNGGNGAEGGYEEEECDHGVDTSTPDVTQSEEQYEDYQPSNGAIVSALCGLSTPIYGLDDSEYEGSSPDDCEGNMISEQSRSYEDEDSLLMVGAPRCTPSGHGRSVDVDLLPDEDIIWHANSNELETQSGGSEEEVGEDEESKVDLTGPFDSVPVLTNSESSILNVDQMKCLLSSGAMPQSLNFCKWKRLYSLARDGDSFKTFLTKVEGHERTVLVVKTSRNELFGGYADTRWEGRHHRHQSHEFYGSAQACLFRFLGGPGGVSGRDTTAGVRVYKWTGANRYIQLCDQSKRSIAFGGGGNEGEFGLCIEDDFRRGTTGHCSTFENDPLCDAGYFDIQDLEVWGFTLAF